MENPYIWVTLLNKLVLDLWQLILYQEESQNQRIKAKIKPKNKNWVIATIKAKVAILSLMKFKWESEYFQGNFIIILAN
jgi:hypothetical protein